MIILFLIVWLGAVQDQQPKLKMSSYYVDLGEVQKSVRDTFYIDMVNEGEALLKIGSAEGNCSCLKVVDFPNTLKPGEEGRLMGYFFSQTAGESFKYIHIKTNEYTGAQKVGVKAVIR